MGGWVGSGWVVGGEGGGRLPTQKWLTGAVASNARRCAMAVHCRTICGATALHLRIERRHAPRTASWVSKDLILILPVPSTTPPTTPQTAHFVPESAIAAVEQRELVRAARCRCVGPARGSLQPRGRPNREHRKAQLHCLFRCFYTIRRRFDTPINLSGLVLDFWSLHRLRRTRAPSHRSLTVVFGLTPAATHR